MKSEKWVIGGLSPGNQSSLVEVEQRSNDVIADQPPPFISKFHSRFFFFPKHIAEWHVFRTSVTHPDRNAIVPFYNTNLAIFRLISICFQDYAGHFSWLTQFRSKNSLQNANKSITAQTFCLHQETSNDRKCQAREWITARDNQWERYLRWTPNSTLEGENRREWERRSRVRALRRGGSSIDSLINRLKVFYFVHWRIERDAERAEYFFLLAFHFA